MKKLSLSILGAMLLTVFSSCSFFQQNSSVSIAFPGDTAARLSVLKDMETVTAETPEPYFVRFTSTGEWEMTETKRYAALDQINNSKLEFTELTPNKTIKISLELGYNDKTYYKAESELTLVEGENPLTMKLELIQNQVGDFGIKAVYDFDKEKTYNGSEAVPCYDDILIFSHDCTYESDSTIEWKINDQVFDGTINPSTTELTLKKDGLNKVECTITDKIFAKVTKSATLNFDFKTITIPEFNIGVSYEDFPEDKYDKNASIPKYNSNLIFKNDSTYDGSVVWKINDQIFDGTINPESTELKLVAPGANKVECTITDKYLTKISKTVSFDFNFEVMEIPDFTIEAGYGEFPETKCDGSAPIPRYNSTLTFKNNSTYDGTVVWKIGGQVFDGTINPKTTELKLEIPGTIVVECTITDKKYTKLSKTAKFEFGFEVDAYPDALTLSFEKATEPANTVTFGDVINLVVKEAKSLPADTVYTWKLDEKNISLADLKLDTAELCSLLFEDKAYTLEVTASYGGWTAKDSLTFTVTPSKHFPETLTLKLQDETTPANTVTFLDTPALAIAEYADFKEDTTLVWTLDGKEIEINDFIFDTAKYCNLLHANKDYKLEVKAAYKELWSATGSLTITVAPSKHFPETLTLKLKDETTPANTVTFLDTPALAIAEYADFKEDTTLVWTLDGKEIEINDFIFDTAKYCNLLHANKDYKLEVKAAYKELWSATGSLTITVAPSKHFPKTITVELETATTPANTVVYGNKYALAIKEIDDLLPGTKVTMKINGIDYKFHNLEFDTTICDILNDVKEYKIVLTTTYEDLWTAEGELDLTLDYGEGKFDIGEAVPAFTIEPGSAFEINEAGKPTIHIGEEAKFTLKPTTAPNFILGTEYVWKLNGKIVEGADSSEITLDLIKNPNIIYNTDIGVGKNILTVIVSNGSVYKSYSLEFILEEAEEKDDIILMPEPTMS